jgi:hypothetical protein
MFCMENDKIIPALFASLAYARLIGDLASEEYFQRTIKDSALMRRIGLLDAIKAVPETAFEYFDKDANKDPYQYDADTEAEIIKIKETIVTFIADILREENADLGELLGKL